MKPARQQQLSPPTLAAYDADWRLFRDWCHTTDRVALPATPDTLLAFLQACPAAIGTLRRRVTAIHHHHHQAGTAPPAHDSAVAEVLHRVAPTERLVDDTAVTAGLLALPSHGWTQGLFGRRDRLLLVLRAAGVRPELIATATAGDLTVDGTGATLFIGDGRGQKLGNHPDARVCGSCVAARWLRLLNLFSRSVSHRPLEQALATAVPVTGTSTHACRRPVSADSQIAAMPLLPRFDQWGYTTLPPAPIQPRSLQRLAAAHLAAAPPRRRSLARAAETEVELEPDQTTAAAPRPLGPPDRAAGIAARHWQKQQAAELDRLLDDLDARINAALEVSRTGPL